MAKKKVGKTVRAKKAKKQYGCAVCGLAISVDNVCGCVDECDIICCGEQMKSK